MVKSRLSIGATGSVGVTGLLEPEHPTTIAPSTALVHTTTPRARLRVLTIIAIASPTSAGTPNHSVYATTAQAWATSGSYNRECTRHVPCPPMHVGLDKENQR